MAVTAAEWAASRRARRAKAFQCKTCGIPLREHDRGKFSHCEDCREDRGKHRNKYRKTKHGRMMSNAITRRQYAKDPEKYRKKTKVEREEMITLGVCTYCRSEDALPGRRYGAACQFKRGKVHFATDGKVTCKAAARWSSAFLVTTTEPTEVTCSHCQRGACFEQAKAAA